MFPRMDFKKKKISNGTLAAIVVLTLIIADQLLKIWVKTSFRLGESMPWADWAELYFIENPGMAFGIELGSKLFLTLFRIIASAALVYFLFRIRKDDRYTKGFVVCMSLITAGAIGNVIDCMFYGMVFSESTPLAVAQLFPDGGGYASFLHGRVVDMFHFPLLEGTWPEWMPWVGGTDFEFFRPVFNLADAAISVGIIVFILFYSNYLSSPKKTEPTDDASVDNSK